MDKSPAYMPKAPLYDMSINYGSVEGGYWGTNAYLHNDVQPSNSAPFFQSQEREVIPNQFSSRKTPIIGFAGHSAPSYQPIATGTSSQYTPAAIGRGLQMESQSFRMPPAKRQRTSSLAQPVIEKRGDVVFDTDQASLCESGSDCCSSCSGEDICCEPCDEPACVEAVEICSQQSCAKPACRDECLSTAFRIQGSLGQVEDSAQSVNSSQDEAPWNSHMLQHRMGQHREGSTHTRVNASALDFTPIPTPPSLVDITTPASSYLPTPQSNGFDHQAHCYQGTPADLSGTGAIFSNGAEQWTVNTFGCDPNAPEVLPCTWEGCGYVCMSHNEWIAHFHEAHIDPQMSFGCPIPQDDCPPTMTMNPIDHLAQAHGYSFDFSAGALSCPATTCPPDQTYYSPSSFHDHLDHYHATPVHGSLQCKLQACGTEFDDPNQFFSHMSNHLHPSTQKAGDDIDLLTPPLSVGASVGTEKKADPSDSVDLPHLCKWKSTNGNICNLECASASDLQDHIKSQHLVSLSKSTGYVCQWDGCLRDSNLGEKAGFSQRGKLDRHMATHTGFKCSVCPHCGQFFSAPQALKQHILLHTGEKPWKCKHCDKRFPQQSACTIHERTHTNEKPLECNVCGKKFSESSNLAKHRKIHGEKGLHACAVPGCGKSFHRLDQLKRHALTHDKPLKEGAKKRRVTKTKLAVEVSSDWEAGTTKIEVSA